VGTHFADHYKTYLFRLRPDNKTLDRASAVLVNEGAGREASKLLKVGKWYCLVFSEHKNGVGRYVMAKRAQKITGPYREEKQLALPSTEAREPNQGGLVPGPDGQWYFLTHHGTGDWSGRVMSLLPVTWLDGWPIIGQVLPTGLGTMAWQGKMPRLNTGTRPALARGDDFDSTALGPQWQWNYQPRPDKYALQERPGWLRLKAFAPLQKDDLLHAGNTLTQPSFRSYANEVTVKLDLAGMADGQKSGLCHFSQDHAALGVVQRGATRYLEYRHGSQREQGPPLPGRHVWLRSVWGLDGRSQFAYSLDGDTYQHFGAPYQLAWGYYRGDRLGLYCFNDLGENGLVDVDYFHYAMQQNAPGPSPPQP
jgi:beta-xylosidase